MRSNQRFAGMRDPQHHGLPIECASCEIGRRAIRQHHLLHEVSTSISNREVAHIALARIAHRRDEWPCPRQSIIATATADRADRAPLEVFFESARCGR